jgi:hypothetical protein
MLEAKARTQECAQINEIHISYDSAKEIKKSLSSMKLKDDSSWLDTKLWLGNVLKYNLPKSTLESIVDFKKNDHKCALIIRGLPIDNDLCATPYKGYLEASVTPLASACHIDIYQLANIEPVSYKTENNGFLFRHVVPSLTGRNEKSSHGSTHTFGHHVDNPDLPLTSEVVTEKSGCPEFLSLMALRSDLSVRSNFLLIDELLARLSKGVIAELTKPQFTISRPDSFGQTVSTVLPLLTYDSNNVAYCRYDKENTTPRTEKAAAALVMLEAQLAEKTLQNHIVYQPGDLLIIKNQRTLHSREGFSPRDDGADRWLTRLFGMHSLDRLVQAYSDKKHIGND